MMRKGAKPLAKHLASWSRRLERLDRTIWLVEFSKRRQRRSNVFFYALGQFAKGSEPNERGALPAAINF